MLNVVIPHSKEKIAKSIKALKYALTQDKTTKDIQIHQQALEQLEKAYKAI